MLSDLKEFEKLEPEIVYRLPTARLVFADHELLQRDFPHLRDNSLIKIHPELKQMKRPAKAAAIGHILDQWLMSNAAFVSESQLRQSRVNTPIEMTDEQVMAFRPPDFGRALIFSLEVNRRWPSGVRSRSAGRDRNPVIRLTLQEKIYKRTIDHKARFSFIRDELY